MIRRNKRIERWRLLSQFSFAVLWFLPFFARYGTQSIICPAFHCHGCPWSSFACPIGIISSFIALGLIPYLALSILGVIGAFGGRIVCGWACPFGLLQDLLGKLKRNKLEIPQWLGYMKYAMLIGLAVVVPMLYTMKSHYTFCGLCPAGTLEAAIPMTIKSGTISDPGRFALRVGILVAVLLFTVLVSRGFCRVFCPLGAIFSIFNRISLFRFRLVRSNCNSCGSCAKTCPVDIDPVKDMNTEECIKCLDCTTTKCIKLGVK